MWQAEAVRDALMTAHGLPEAAIEIVVVKTSGDRIRDRALAEAGGKGLFTKEIESALVSGEVDVAVHSAKDMETFLPAGLTIGAVLAREDARDALVARGADFARGAAFRRADRLRLHSQGGAAETGAARSHLRAAARQCADAAEARRGRRFRRDACWRRRG